MTEDQKDKGCCGGCHADKKQGEILKTFDMYHFFSRKDVILVMAFTIAFLIFALAIFLYPQIA